MGFPTLAAEYRSIDFECSVSETRKARRRCLGERSIDMPVALAASGLSSLDFWVGRSLRCQAVVSQPHGIHRLATVATLGRANHSEPQPTTVNPKI